MSAAAPLLCSLLEDLRRATASRHAALDARLTAAGCTDTLDGYAAFLAGTARFRLVLETTLDAADIGAVLDDWPCRRRGSLLLDDLRDLGRAFPEAPSADPPALARHDVARLLGAAYVLEGSVLGGAVLYRRAASLGVDATRGASYLHACSLATRDWPVFLDRLKCLDVVELDRAAALDAARETFDYAGACY